MLIFVAHFTSVCDICTTKLNVPFLRKTVNSFLKKLRSEEKSLIFFSLIYDFWDPSFANVDANSHLVLFLPEELLSGGWNTGFVL